MLDSVVRSVAVSPSRLLNFSGHETFPFRYPWLTKAIQELNADPELFSKDDALVTLGVGKNMVRSMRHWGQVLGLIERPNSKQPTELGKRLFLEEGWDPYLEDVGTLWLLHWQLVSNPEQTSTWHYAFTRWGPSTFTKAQLIDWLVELADKSSKKISRNTIERDVEVFLRTYVPSKPKGALTLEETFDSPLIELGLLCELDRNTYQFVLSEQTTLPDEIFTYALQQYWALVAPERQTLDAGRLLHGPGSPGGAFKLMSNALFARLERLPTWSGLRFDATAGLKQVLKVNDMKNPLEPLERYYQNGEA